MEKNIRMDIVENYIATIPLIYKDELAGIRSEQQIMIASYDNLIYIKNINENILKSNPLKNIPHCSIYKINDGLLFYPNSLVPIKAMPKGILWSPIAKIIPLQLPTIDRSRPVNLDECEINLVLDTNEQQAAALLVDAKIAKDYLEQNSVIRSQNMKWVLWDNKMFIIGYPLLPLPGKAYWQVESFFIPMGFNFELPILKKQIERKVNPNKSNVVVWNEAGNYVLINQVDFKPLQLSSVRKTWKQ
jgi:hypothetical protein